PGHRLLDIGCGTGTLAVLIKREQQDVEIIGIDPDPKALARARRKAVRAGVAIQFDQGFGDGLPYADASFDRVIASFMFHHLPAEEKVKTLGAIRRVLKPGGRLHMVDFERTESGAHGFLARLFHASERMKDNSENRVLSLMSEAGFRDPSKIGERTMLSGQIAYFQAAASGKRHWPLTNFDCRPRPQSRQPDCLSRSRVCGGMLRAIGSARMNLPRRMRDVKAHGSTPTCTVRKAIRAMLPIGTLVQASPFVESRLMSSGSASQRLCCRSDYSKYTGAKAPIFRAP